MISVTRPCFLTVGLLQRSCLALAASTNESCGRNRASITKLQTELAPGSPWRLFAVLRRSAGAIGEGLV